MTKTHCLTSLLFHYYIGYVVIVGCVIVPWRDVHRCNGRSLPVVSNGSSIARWWCSCYRTRLGMRHQCLWWVRVMLRSSSTVWWRGWAILYWRTQVSIGIVPVKKSLIICRLAWSWVQRGKIWTHRSGSTVRGRDNRNSWPAVYRSGEVKHRSTLWIKCHVTCSFQGGTLSLQPSWEFCKFIHYSKSNLQGHFIVLVLIVLTPALVRVVL